MSGASPAVEFTPEQRAAIERREGRLLLSANAGSGKTSVLVERFVAMLIDDQIAPDAVLAVTFTEKAAGEMRARIRTLLIARGRRDLVAEAEEAWVSTLHGFCARVLRQHAIAAGLDPAFTVLEEGEARQLRSDAFGQALAELMRDGRPEILDFAAAFGADPLQEIVEAAYDLLRTRGARRPRLPDVAEQPAPDAAELRAAVDTARTHLVTAGTGKTLVKARDALEALAADLEAGAPAAAGIAGALPSGGNTGALKEGPYADARAELERYCQACRDVEARAAVGHLDSLLDGYGAAYETLKRGASVVDWADLELLTRDLLRDHTGVRNAYRSRFERVMVDEFQDINPLQLELIELIDDANTFVVGDEFQSIYGFRHADVEVFRGWRADRDRAGEALVLPANFRSHPGLIAALNVAFAPVHGEAFTALQRGSDSGRDWDGPRVELLLTATQGWEASEASAGLASEKAWRAAEARLVAARVAELIDAGFQARDVAVLLRAAGDMGVYERALEERGVATLANGSGGFWARRQILDLLAYLAAVANPRDELALFSLLASPICGLSSTALAALSQSRKGERWRVIEVGGAELRARLSAADSAALDRFVTWFLPLRERASMLAIDELIEYALTELGYDLHVLALPAGRRRFANLLKLQRLAATYEARHGRDVRGFIDRARSEMEAEAREPEAPVELGEADAVQLMTMHASKGLQFKVVVCADLGRETYAQVPALMIEGDKVGLRLSSLTEKAMPALAFEELKEQRRAREAAEQQRLLYVAMTRAQELLILSGGVRLDRWPSVSATAPPIAWIGPAVVPGIEGHLAGDAVTVVDTAAMGHEGSVRLVLSTPEREAELLRAREAGAQLELGVRDGAPAVLSAAPPAPAPPGVPSRLSYSSLSSYGRCGYEYYLRSVLRLPRADPGDLVAPSQSPAGIDPLLRGSIVHELLEQLDLRDPRLPSTDAVVSLAAAHDADFGDEQVAECLALVAAFIDGPSITTLRTARAISQERGFAFALDDGPLVNGIVDVLADLGDGRSIVLDYKSDQVTEGEDLEDRVRADYGVQRAIYALAALRGGAESVEVVHLFLNRPDEPATATFTLADVPALEDEIRSKAAGLLAGDFTPTETPHRDLCATCPGRAALCSWDAAMTERELPA